ncbi:MAG: hypothetical protein ACYSWU_19575 [Planctomycetota bacterium]|jgi:hypothetical protein
MRTTPQPWAAETWRTHQPAGANTAAIITVPADANARHVVDYITYSYNGAAPASATLTIAFGGVTKWIQYITAEQSKEIWFPGGLYNQALTKNEAMVITLAAAGAAVTGKVNAATRSMKGLPEYRANATFGASAVAGGDDVSVSLPATTGVAHVLDFIHASYAVAPASGSVSVTIGGSGVWQVDITAAGDHYFNFDPPIYGARGSAMALTMADGGQAKKFNYKYR